MTPYLQQGLCCESQRIPAVDAAAQLTPKHGATNQKAFVELLPTARRHILNNKGLV